LRGLNSFRILAGWLALSVCLPAQQYVFHPYRQDEGLKNLVVQGLASGRGGLLWIATENGVYHFLGSEFERFGPEQGITDVDVRDILSDPDGTIWAGTQENLFRREGEKFVPAGPKPIHIQGSRQTVLEDAAHLLVVDQHRLYRLGHDWQQRFVSYTPVFSSRLLASHPELSQISSLNILKGRSGNETGHRTIWMGCGQKLCSWRDDKASSPDASSSQEAVDAVTVWGADKGLAEDHWLTVLMGQDGTLWAASQHHIAVLPKGATRFIDRTIPGTDQQGVYRGEGPLVEDREGRILTVSEDRISRWEGSSWHIIGQTNGLMRGGYLTCLLFDASGDLWIGSRGLGLNHWVGYEDWEGWNDIRGISSAETWSISSTGDRTFVGTQKGPAWIDSRNGASGSLSSKFEWAYGQVSAIGTNRDGSLWGGTFSGAVLHLDSHTGQVAQTAKLPGLILKGVQDSVGNVFFATNKGIYRRDAAMPNASPRLVTEVDALVGASTRFEAGCAARDDSLWFVGKNQILREKNGAWTAPPIDGMPKVDGALMALACGADGSLWVTGAQSGTWRLTPVNGRLQAWKLEIPSAYRWLAPLAILRDSRGWIWLGTDEGLLAWNGKSWRHLTQESGLIWNDVDQGVLANAPDGSIWIGTSGGLSHLIHPEHVFDSVPLSFLIMAIQRGRHNYPVAQKVVLPWSTEPMRFRFAISSMRNRSETHFQYRMEGLKQDWVDTQDASVAFSTLPPGKFTFMARISNPGLGAVSDLKKVEIQILPPWWKSYWFYALCGIAFLLLIALGIRLRDRQLRFRSRQLERLVRERTHELELSREQLRIQATHDELTGMLNREAVLRVLTAEMDRARREGGTLVVALADLDYFKAINDTYGHLAGDEALRWFAAAVGAAIRVYDHAGRYGGEEFLMVLTEIPREAVLQRLTSLHASISNLRVRVRGLEFAATCSIGATVFDSVGGLGSVESILAVADLALYAAKDAGRNRVILFGADGNSMDSKLIANDDFKSSK
jgi:diguanylate cyclase (GGDEF)-like protein